jgi:hypothetical protein
VLGTPPAFILSQDQTLQMDETNLIGRYAKRSFGFELESTLVDVVSFCSQIELMVILHYQRFQTSRPV